jgi:Protein phosphatase 2C
MNADSIYMIGATHSVCQDYVVANGSYVILSDGCSTSPETDIGSRLLVKATEKQLKNTYDPETLHEDAARLALTWAEAIGLPAQAVDATLLTAFNNDDELIVGCSGDGVIVTETTDGSRDFYEISYPSGYPLYPSYLHQPERLATLATNGRSIKEVRHFSNAGLLRTHRCDSPTHVMRLTATNYRFVALMSDGVRSFFTAAGSGIEPLELSVVIPELLSFKSWNGAFVARRVKRFMRDCRSKGWQHADDLSIGVIHTGGDQCSPKPFQI